MRVYVDASTKDTHNGVGIVVMHHNKIITRIGSRYTGLTSMDAEWEALKEGVAVAQRYIADVIYSDCNHLESRIREEPFEEENVVFINRSLNLYADGLSKLEVDRFPWRDEYKYRLLAYPLSDPMEWKVVEAGTMEHVVHIHNKKFYCTCEQSNTLLKRKVPCRHIMAVWRKINFITEDGAEAIF